MKAGLLTFILFPIYMEILGQPDTTTLELLNPFGCIEIPPKYPGGFRAIQKLFANSAQYPKEAEKQRLGGRVVVTYMVDTFGNTRNVKISKSAGSAFDEEAVRLVRMLKGWKPATLNDKKIVYYQGQPFVFVPKNNKGQKKAAKKNCR